MIFESRHATLPHSWAYYKLIFITSKNPGFTTGTIMLIPARNFCDKRGCTFPPISQPRGKKKDSTSDEVITETFTSSQRPFTAEIIYVIVANLQIDRVSRGPWKHAKMKKNYASTYL